MSKKESVYTPLGVKTSPGEDSWALEGGGGWGAARPPSGVLGAAPLGEGVA
jgi:hypothetical protein